MDKKIVKNMLDKLITGWVKVPRKNNPQQTPMPLLSIFLALEKS